MLSSDCGSTNKSVIIGGGISGLSTGLALAQAGRDVVVLEKTPATGGLASTLHEDGYSLDTGSHRIHPNYEPEALALVRSLLGDELLSQPRRGQILINKRFINYPPNILSLMQAIGILGTARAAAGLIAARSRGAAIKDTDDFRTHIVKQLGTPLYEAFYLPYARKLWGRSPDDISAGPAQNRIHKFSVATLFADITRWAVTAGRAPRYHYPAGGIGQIAARMRERLIAAGGRVMECAEVDRIRLRKGSPIESITARNATDTIEFRPETVIATAPLSALHHLVRFENETAPPPFDLESRSLRLVYLVLPGPSIFRPETFYIPDPDYLAGRVSELRKYSPRLNPDENQTVLCVEIPCSAGDSIQTMENRLIEKKILGELKSLGIITAEQSSAPIKTFHRFLPDIYPVHRRGWQTEFHRAYDRLAAVPNLFLVGRSALFLHCNIDHCIIMANELTRILSGPDARRTWDGRIESFFSFTVKD